MSCFDPISLPHSHLNYHFSRYEMYSEDNLITTNAGNEPMSKGQSNVNPDAPAIELIELSNGETIW